MTVNLPRGFKAECERTSDEVRKELGITLSDRLDPFVLADYLGVPVYALSESETIGFAPDVISILASDSTGFSALTIGDGPRRAVLYNDYHHPNRIASDIAHELSHIFLRHSLLPTFGPGGSRNWHDGHENEAIWHSGALLVPRDGAYMLLKRGMSYREAAVHTGVSESLFHWRAQMTGITKVLGLTRAG